MMAEQILIKYFKTSYGELILGDFKGKLCLADWLYRKMRGAIDKRIQTTLKAQYIEGNSKLLEESEKQLNEYFKKKRTHFDIPLHFAGTDFQKQVRQALIQIPYGKTETYLGLSKTLGDEKAIRAVATANGANAISIIVPCHRIIGSDNSMVGYAGGITAKKKLLQLEGALSQLELF
jgi:methylated-DNA-[protein]-cysteine S-methyltransferase